MPSGVDQEKKPETWTRGEHPTSICVFPIADHQNSREAASQGLCQRLLITIAAAGPPTELLLFCSISAQRSGSPRTALSRASNVGRQLVYMLVQDVV